MADVKYARLLEPNKVYVNPKAKAGFLSRLTFWWMNGLFITGSERPLENHDLYPLLDADRTEKLTEKLQQEFNKLKDLPGNKRTRLLKALIYMFPGYLYMFTICAGLTGALCNVLQPVFLSLLLSQLVQTSPLVSYKWCYIYAIGICICSLIRCLVLQQFAEQNLLTAMRWRVATIGMIFKKVLLLSETTITNVSSGLVLDLVSGDVQRFDKVCFLVGFLALSVPEVAAVICFMWYLIGWKSLSGALFMLLLVCYYSVMGGVCAALRLKMAKITDRRLGIMGSVVCGIKAIKMYAWEWPFRDMVQEVRRQEINVLRKRSAILATFPSLQFSSTAIASLISLVTLASTGTELTTYNVFVVVALLSTIRVTVCENIAKGAFSIGEFVSSIERIQAFLELEELPNLHDKHEVENRMKTSKEFLSVVKESTESTGTDNEEGSLLTDSGLEKAKKKDSVVKEGTEISNGTEIEEGSSLTDSELEKAKKEDSVVKEGIEISNGTEIEEGSSSSSEKSLLTDSELEKAKKEDSKEPKQRRQRRLRKSKGSVDHSLRQVKLSLLNVTCHWIKGSEKPNLNNVSCEAFDRELVLVTGPVGCGKSTLLSTILGELPTTSGKITCNGKIAHVSQSPWVFSGTIRSNILFGKRYDPRQYEAVLQACDLERDINSLPDRDATRIGERGTTLSGGQRTRIALARAVYSDADIYLLDDPLGAVDSKVGRNLFERCIQGILGKKIRILVTHQLQYLQNADHIILMNDGEITSEGSYADICKTGEEIAFLQKEEKTSVTPRPLYKDISLEVENWKESHFSSLQPAEEDRQTGAISWYLYWRYLTAGVKPLFLILLAMIFIFVQAFLILPDVWLLHLTNMPREERKKLTHFYTYGGLVAVALLLSVLRASLFFSTVLNSSQMLHDEMVQTVLKAPVLFFDTNPVGRIMNRFSKDIGSMDELLPDVLLDALQLILFSLGAIILPSVINPWLIFAVIPLVTLFIIIGKYYLKTSREIKRLEAINRSPVFAHFADTLEGVVTMRCHHMQHAFVKRLYKYQDVHNQSWFVVIETVRWLAIRLDILCVIFETVVVLGALFAHSGPGMTALSLIYAAQLAFDTSQVSVRQCSEVENYMTSVERVVSYTDLEPEPGYDIQNQPPDRWPATGDISLENVSLNYYDGGPQVLKDINVKIPNGQKVGVVGRTGAGKSSLVRAIYQMPKPDGQILVDGVDIGTINIQRARSSISVISQHPIIFSGSLRMNLDPFNRFTDADLWHALEQASLKTLVSSLPQQLYYEFVESGFNLSAGERQLFCLARALLQRSKIIIMDEATANVDYHNERIIQGKVKDNFAACTVLIIAHRLGTIMHCDEIMVIDGGRLAETGQPNVLSEKRNSLFARMYRSYQESGYFHGQKR